MRNDEAAKARAWLAAAHGIRLPAAKVADPAGMAADLMARARAATANLPLDGDGLSFTATLESLAKPGKPTRG